MKTEEPSAASVTLILPQHPYSRTYPAITGAQLTAIVAILEAPPPERKV